MAAAFRELLTCAAWIDLDDPTTSVRSFVVEYRDELPQEASLTCVACMSRVKPLRLRSSTAIRPIDDLPGGRVQVIAALVGDVFLILGEGNLALGATLRSSLASGKGALALAQALGRLLGKVRTSAGCCRRYPSLSRPLRSQDLPQTTSAWAVAVVR